MRAHLTGKDQRRLRLVTALRDPAHLAWALVPEDIRSNGRATFAMLTDWLSEDVDLAAERMGPFRHGWHPESGPSHPRPP